MCVCVYVCVRACVRACMRACVFMLDRRVCMHDCFVSICMHMYLSACMYMKMHA